MESRTDAYGTAGGRVFYDQARTRSGLSAAEAYVAGDPVAGGAAVAARYRKDAASFKPGGTTRFEVLQKESSGHLDFWTGIPSGDGAVRRQDKPVKMKIRVTEVFRIADGEWMMVHRHPDIPQKPRQ